MANQATRYAGGTDFVPIWSWNGDFWEQFYKFFQAYFKNLLTVKNKIINKIADNTTKNFNVLKNAILIFFYF